MINLSTLGVVTCVPLAVIFGIIALLNARHINENESIVFYLTARNTMDASMIALSFVGITCGAWLFFWPSAMIADPIEGAGWLGLITISFSYFGAICMIAWLGSHIRVKYPDIISIGQYAKERFGYSTQIFVTAVSFGSLTMTMAQDYTALGIIFSQMLGIQPLFPIMTVGIATAFYTSFGGVYVSMMTHKYQLPFVLLLLFIVAVYVGTTFDWSNLGPLPPHLGLTRNGGKSLIMFTISVFSNLFFSDAMWQRVWAARDSKSLKNGGIYGGGLTFIVIFIFGIFAFLSSWSGVHFSQNALYNILGNDAPYWILIVISMLAITINESTIDSIQNALVNNLVSLAMSFGYGLSLNWTRMVVLMINIPIILICIQGLDIISIILFSDMITAFTMAPILLSMFPFFDDYIDQTSLIFCYVFSMIGLLLYGYLSTVLF